MGGGARLSPEAESRGEGVGGETSAHAALEGRASDVARGMRQSATKRGLAGKKLKKVEKAARYILRNKEVGLGLAMLAYTA